MNRFKISENMKIFHKRKHIPKETQVIKRNLYQVVIPKSVVNTLIRAFHEKSGHFGQDKCEKAINKFYWWPNMREEIRSHIVVCTECQQIKNRTYKPYGTGKLMSKTTEPFETVNLDCFGPCNKTLS